MKCLREGRRFRCRCRRRAASSGPHPSRCRFPFERWMSPRWSCRRNGSYWILNGWRPALPDCSFPGRCHSPDWIEWWLKYNWMWIKRKIGWNEWRIYPNLGAVSWSYLRLMERWCRECRVDRCSGSSSGGGTPNSGATTSTSGDGRPEVEAFFNGSDSAPAPSGESTISCGCFWSTLNPDVFRWLVLPADSSWLWSTTRLVISVWLWQSERHFYISSAHFRQQLTLPEDVVDADDALLVAVLRVAHDRGAGLDPGKSPVAVQDSVIGRHDLSFVHHCNQIESNRFKRNQTNQFPLLALM